MAHTLISIIRRTGILVGIVAGAAGSVACMPAVQASHQAAAPAISLADGGMAVPNCRIHYPTIVSGGTADAADSRVG